MAQRYWQRVVFIGPVIGSPYLVTIDQTGDLPSQRPAKGKKVCLSVQFTDVLGDVSWHFSDCQAGN